MNDTIYRQDAIDVADAIWSVTGDKNVAKVWDQLKDLPSVQPERMRGRWETDGMMMDDGEYMMTRCTACGTAYEYGHDENYCGFCGADMRGEQDE